MEKRIIKFDEPPTPTRQQTEASTAMSSLTFLVTNIPKKPMPQMRMLVNPPEE